jgi:tetratricopeptide (TPR) repeat protein
VTVLRNAAVYGLTLPLAERIRDHFTNTAQWRAYLAERVRPLFGRDSEGAVRMQTLEAASLFEQGIDFYEQQEHDDARSLFERAVAADPKNPLLHAWHARVASLLRSDEEAAAAQRASELLTADTPRVDRLFVEASTAEARGDASAAAAGYAALVDEFGDEPMWIIERAAFEDRQFRNQDAITSYHAALAADPRLVRPHLELCRMYGPGRANLPANAEMAGRIALARYQELAARAGEVQARWCLIDVLRVGGAEQVNEARMLADGALAIVESLGYDYNLSRALNYVALAAAAQGNAPEAIAFWERSLAAAERAGNRPLQPLALMNLGVANQRLGQVTRALDYTRRSAAGFERLGQQQRAAQLQANAAQIIIDYGGDAPNLLRDIDNALAVFKRFRDRDFEVFALHLRAAYYRNVGRYTDAERDIVQAKSIAQQHDLHENRVRVLLDHARLKFELGDYAEARKALADAKAVDAGPNAPEIAVLLGRIHTRLEEYDAAQTQFTAAAEAIGRGGTATVMPLVHVAQGELEFRRHNFGAARTQFERAVSLGNAAFRDEVTIEAAAYGGLIDALHGATDRGRRAVAASLEDAARLPRYALEAKCRLLLARVELAGRRFADAAATLAAIPDDGDRTVGAPLRAEIEAARRELAAAGVRSR